MISRDFSIIFLQIFQMLFFWVFWRKNSYFLFDTIRGRAKLEQAVSVFHSAQGVYRGISIDQLMKFGFIFGRNRAGLLEPRF